MTDHALLPRPDHTHAVRCPSCGHSIASHTGAGSYPCCGERLGGSCYCHWTPNDIAWSLLYGDLARPAPPDNERIRPPKPDAEVRRPPTPANPPYPVEASRAHRIPGGFLPW